MTYRFWSVVAGLVCAVIAATPVWAQTPARGIVFHDRDGDGRLTEGDSPIPGVRVSNGLDIVTTDDQGRYELPIDDDAIVFVIKPRGWRTPVNELQLPQFYYIHKPAGSPQLQYPGVQPTGPLPQSIDFPLYPQDEPDRFQAIFFGDTQARDIEEIDYMAEDVIAGLVGTDAAFGVTLGDIVFNDLSVFEPHNKTVALIGIPWYNVIGNHDINQDAAERRHANETYERLYGPSYYSFDYGPVHFLVLDNIDWIVPPSPEEPHYRGGFGERQLAFIANDLAAVENDRLVVLTMHIPLNNSDDRHALYRLIEQRPFCISLSAHQHYHEHRFIDRADGWQGAQPHHHIVNVTVCGSWWGGLADERGIPHTTMADGAPNGYSIMTFDGHDYRLDFRAAGRSADYQMNIMAPNEVTTEALNNSRLWVNVFNGNQRTNVEMRIGDRPWQRLEQQAALDPDYVRQVALEKQFVPPLPRSLPKPVVTPHLWTALLPTDLAPGSHVIEIRATEENRFAASSRRIIRVTDSSQAEPATSAR
jgi:hypothetical protein